MRKLTIYAALLGVFFFAIAPNVQAVEQSTAQVPIIMYHSVAGDHGNTSISPEKMKADFQYLRDAGFQAVTIASLVDFVHHGTPLPDKPIVLSFDDGYYNNYSAVFPLAIEFEMPFVVSVIGKDTEIWSDSPAIDERHGHLTWAQIREMADTNLVEMLNHTWDLHKIEHGRKGAAICPGEEQTAYQTLLREDLGKLQTQLTEHCGITPIGFTYPFGNISPEAQEVLMDLGFLATLSCMDGVNTITQGNPDCLYKLRRYERTPGQSVQQILEGI